MMFLGKMPKTQSLEALILGHPQKRILTKMKSPYIDDRKKILDGALAAFGRVDVLVNNAGVAPKVRADLLDMSEESFDYVVGINTKGNMFLTQLVAKQMISQEPVDGPSNNSVPVFRKRMHEKSVQMP